MGLDTYLFRRSINRDDVIIRELEEDNSKEEVAYWRKEYDINDWFLEKLGTDNCEEKSVEYDVLVEFINYLKDLVKITHEENLKEREAIFKQAVKDVQEIIDTTDWETQEIVFFAWW